jgi:alpha-aminoadipate/glutamate carrier protein LysW
MKVEFVKCPTCKQRLAVMPYVDSSALVVCANLSCGTSLRIVGRRPLRVEAVAEIDTYHVDYRPESYG